MTVNVYTSFDEIPAPRRARLSYAEQQDLFASLEWFGCLAAHGLPSDTAFRIYAASDAQGENGCWLFAMHRAGERRLESLSAFYTMSFGPVYTGTGGRDALLDMLIAHIAAERPRWSAVDFRLLRAERKDTEALVQALRRHGFAAETYFQYDNYFCNVESLDFAAYYASRSSRTQNTIRRKEKKLNKAHRTDIRLVNRFDEQAVAGYNAVYGKSWKNAEQYPGFIDALCRLASNLGLLRMGVLTVDGTPAAAQLWFLSGRTAIIYKLAYDEDYKEHSVGSILTRDMMESALSEDGVHEFDYGVGSEPYKKEWMEDKRVLIGVEAFNRATLLGQIGALRRAIGKFLKSLKRRHAS